MTKTVGPINLSHQCGCDEIRSILEAKEVFCTDCIDSKNGFNSRIEHYSQSSDHIRCVVSCKDGDTV